MTEASTLFPRCEGSWERAHHATHAPPVVYPEVVLGVVNPAVLPATPVPTYLGSLTKKCFCNGSKPVGGRIV